MTYFRQENYGSKEWWDSATERNGPQSCIQVKSAGVAIGFDFGEDYLMGTAYTRLDSKVKSLNIDEKIVNNIGTLYGLYNFANDFFVNGQLMYSRSIIKKHRYTHDLLNNIAYSKTKAEMAGEVALGYYYNFIDSSQFIPSIGLVHDNVKEKGIMKLAIVLIEQQVKEVVKRLQLLPV